MKIEITGGPGTGKLALARKIRYLLCEDTMFKYLSVSLRQDVGIDGTPSSEGPDDADCVIIVHEV